MWERDLNINDICEIRTKTISYLGVGAIKKFDSIAKRLIRLGIKKVLVLTGKSSYKKSGAWEVVEKILIEKQIEYILFDQIRPNPEHQDVDAATSKAKAFGAEAVIGIGGGSAIDAAKAVAVLLKHQDKSCAELYLGEFMATAAVPIVAINLTHGTGTEVDRFSVVSIPEKNLKVGIAYEFIYPLYAINDPALMKTLPKFQSMAVSVDAINHVFEACTSKFAHPFTLLCAKETVRLVHKYLPAVLADGDDLEARYYLAYAAMIAGVSFDNGRLHITHALEHPLSAVNTEVTHGLGLAILLPSVLKYCFAERKETIVDVLAPIFDNKSDIETDEAVAMMSAWLKSVGVNQSLKDLGFAEKDVDKLTALVNLERLKQSSPIAVNEELIKAIYTESL